MAWLTDARCPGRVRPLVLDPRIGVLGASRRLAGAITLTWTVLVAGMADTINAIIQSMRYSVFNHALGVNWVIVTIYVPALLVSSALILWQLLRSPAAAALPATVVGNH